MTKHWLAGLIVGGMFGTVTTVIAASTAWSEGGLVAIAASWAGVLGGLGIGGLIGINIAAGEADMEDDAYAQLKKQHGLGTTSAHQHAA